MLRPKPIAALLIALYWAFAPRLCDCPEPGVALFDLATRSDGGFVDVAIVLRELLLAIGRPGGGLGFTAVAARGGGEPGLDADLDEARAPLPEHRAAGTCQGAIAAVRVASAPAAAAASAADLARERALPLAEQALRLAESAFRAGAADTTMVLGADSRLAGIDLRFALVGGAE